MPVGPVKPFSGYDIVNQVVIADSGAPLVERAAFLEADIVDREGDEGFFGHFVRIFVVFHRGHLFYSTCSPEIAVRRPENVFFAKK